MKQTRYFETLFEKQALICNLFSLDLKIYNKTTMTKNFDTQEDNYFPKGFLRVLASLREKK